MPDATRRLWRPEPLDPLVKWPGGKRRELAAIRHAFGGDVGAGGRYLEPFVGGGAVWFAVDPSTEAHVNDASSDLVAIYRACGEDDVRLWTAMDALQTWWDDTDVVAREALAAIVAAFVTGTVPDDADVEDALPATLPVPRWWSAHVDDADVRRRTVAGVVDKAGRMAALQQQRGALPIEDVVANLVGACKAAVYVSLRHLHNERVARDDHDVARIASFWFLREFSYAAMFRFNASGAFNVPYGGLTYNDKRPDARAVSARTPAVRERLATTTVHEGDFGLFLDRVAPTSDDVVFLDPPYDSDFSGYDRGRFGEQDHRRLAAAMAEVPGRCVLVIKDTPFVRATYVRDDWDVQSFDKTYAWTIKERNDRAATHLVIRTR